MLGKILIRNVNKLTNINRIEENIFSIAILKKEDEMKELTKNETTIISAGCFTVYCPDPRPIHPWNPMSDFFKQLP